MLRQLLRGLCTKSAGRSLVAGTIGVLVGVEYLMSSRARTSEFRMRQMEPVERRAEPVQPPASAPAVAQRTNCLRIYRTKSELGYTYWVLQGFGCHQCFLLFDSWHEAMAEADRRRRVASAPAPVFEEQLAIAVSHT